MHFDSAHHVGNVRQCFNIQYRVGNLLCGIQPNRIGEANAFRFSTSRWKYMIGCVVQCLFHSLDAPTIAHTRYLMDCPHNLLLKQKAWLGVLVRVLH